MKNKNGFVFSLDLILAITIFTLLIILFYFGENKNYEEDLILLDITLKTNDLLLTAQILEIDQIVVLKKNYQELFSNYDGYLKINNQIAIINNTEYQKNNFFINSIKYINSSNNEIYIEIGIYY
ncbi:MAG: hypothetical protein PHU47_00640 [Candidatus ainarchaeum sp.]|nr:hypothetical protein [Candidatus ainarchaeum sp.]